MTPARSANPSTAGTMKPSLTDGDAGRHRPTERPVSQPALRAANFRHRAGHPAGNDFWADIHYQTAVNHTGLRSKARQKFQTAG